MFSSKKVCWAVKCLFYFSDIFDFYRQTSNSHWLVLLLTSNDFWQKPFFQTLKIRISTQYHLLMSVQSHILVMYIPATQSLLHVRTNQFRNIQKYFNPAAKTWEILDQWMWHMTAHMPDSGIATDHIWISLRLHWSNTIFYPLNFCS